MELTAILIIILGICLGFFVQTVSGFGAPLIALPILLFFLDLPAAVALLSVFFITFSLIMIKPCWKDVNKKILLDLVKSSIIGLIIGVYLLKYSDPFILKKILGVLIIVYVAYYLLVKKELKLFKGAEWLFGFFGGIVTGLYTASGQIFIIYLFDKLKDPKVVRATTIALFGIINVFTILLFIFNKILTMKIFLTSLYIMPFFLVALFLGQRSYNKINERALKKAMLIILFLSGLVLIVK